CSSDLGPRPGGVRGDRDERAELAVVRLDPRQVVIHQLGGADLAPPDGLSLLPQGQVVQLGHADHGSGSAIIARAATTPGPSNRLLRITSKIAQCAQHIVAHSSGGSWTGSRSPAASYRSSPDPVRQARPP